MTSEGETHSPTHRRWQVVVTGAAGTIGGATCERFLASGHCVHGLDIDVPGLAALKKRCAPLLDGASELITHHVDLRTPPGDARRSQIQCLEPCFADIMAGLANAQKLVLVHSVGAGHRSNLASTTASDWRRDIEFNLDLAYRCVHAVLPTMLAIGRGAIVHIGSVNAHSSLGHPAYSAAKAGLVSLTKSLAVEYGPSGVRANIVSPGTVRSQLWRAREQKNPEVFASLARHYPLGRIVEAREVAEAVYFLASDAASGITGVDLPVDCGLSAGNRVMARDLTQEDF